MLNMMESEVQIGTFIRQPQGFRAFVPAEFPACIRMDWSRELLAKHTQAIYVLGRLDEIARLLPDRDVFMEMFVRKDAATSSQIEGTQASMTDAIEANNVLPGSSVPMDVDDILHYIKALNYGLLRLKELPLSLRLVRELHEILMTRARASHFVTPGEFRRSQNWIGGRSIERARFVPPPVLDMQIALGDWEKYLTDEHNDLPIIKAALLHAQFETIHPFLDGNGRTGRLLLTMYFCSLNLLQAPILYLSSEFKNQQDVYYELLHAYHQGQVETWVDFFVDVVLNTAESSIKTCRKIMEVRERDLDRVRQLGAATAPQTLEVIKHLYRTPRIGVEDVIDWTGYTRAGAYKMLHRLEQLGILIRAADNKKKYEYREYLDLFLETD